MVKCIVKIKDHYYFNYNAYAESDTCPLMYVDEAKDAHIFKNLKLAKLMKQYVFLNYFKKEDINIIRL